MVEQRVPGELVEMIDRLLHGLCQPLMVLQCRLAMAELRGEPSVMREAIVSALDECARLNDAVHAMREMLGVAAERRMREG